MDHNRQVHILPRNGGPPIAGPGPLPAEGLGQGGLGQQDQHHEQAVNMASAPKVVRLVDSFKCQFAQNKTLTKLNIEYDIMWLKVPPFFRADI